jgi:hypothetical protein
MAPAPRLASRRGRVATAAGIDLDALGLDIPDLGDEVRGHQEALGATFNVRRLRPLNSTGNHECSAGQRAGPLS